jgi:hypothetical protein
VRSRGHSSGLWSTGKGQGHGGALVLKRKSGRLDDMRLLLKVEMETRNRNQQIGDDVRFRAQ